MFRTRARGLPRVVFLPGALGTELIDTSLTPAQARRECERNLGVAGDLLLRGTPLYPCDKRPEALWGTIGSLHWLFAPDAWGRRMMTGNGWDQPGNVRPGALVDIDVQYKKKRITFRPYTAFLAGLRGAGMDVLAFPYDWRLSVRTNAGLLQRRILDQWFGGRAPTRPVSDEERVTLIGHSMGGLIARYFLESPLQGHRLARRLITIGTPHRGAPQAWLHLTGRTLPLPDTPLYQQLRAAGIPPPSVSAHGIPPRVQIAVLHAMASTFQLLPVYNFVSNKGRPERYQTTYRDEKHSGTGRTAVETIRELRAGLIDACDLPGWLGRQRLDYHLLAATGFPTPLGYDRGPDRIITGAGGDATVPLTSARLFPHDHGNLRNLLVTGGTLNHARLCERPDVLGQCLPLLRRPRPPVPRQVPPGLVSVDDLVGAARLIMDCRHEPGYRGRVLSVTRLGSNDGKPLVDPADEPVPGSKTRRQLRNPPKHLSSREIEEIDVPDVGRLRYVFILSNATSFSSVGGMLFLGDFYNHMVTYNVGRMDRGYRHACDNAHHAEMHLTRWLSEQDRTFRKRLRMLHIANRSRDTDIEGFSPCRPCCSDLAASLAGLRGTPPTQTINAEISWCERYTGYPRCQHATTDFSLAWMKSAGWGLVERCARQKPIPWLAGARPGTFQGGQRTLTSA
jgi:pimeloyl-ACP methyl ester carboxylesterase